MESVYLLHGWVQGSFYPFLNLYFHRMGFSAAQVGLLGGLTPLVMLLSQPLWGIVADARPRKGRLLSVVLVATAAASLLVPMATMFQSNAIGKMAGPFWVSLLATAVLSFFSSAVIPMVDTLGLQYAERKGLIFPALRSLNLATFMAAATLLGWLYDRYGIHWAFVAYSTSLLIYAAAAWRLPPDNETNQGLSELAAGLRGLIGRRDILAFLILCLIMQSAYAAHGAFFSIYLDGLNAPRGVIGLAWGVGVLSQLPVALLLGRWIQRIGFAPLLVLACLAQALRFFLSGFVRNPWAALALQAMQSVTFGIYYPVAVMLIRQMIPTALRTSGQTLLSLVNFGLAAIIGNVGGGWVVQRWSTSGLYLTGAAVSLVAAIGFAVACVSPVLRPVRAPKTE